MVRSVGLYFPMDTDAVPLNSQWFPITGVRVVRGRRDVSVSSWGYAQEFVLGYEAFTVIEREEDPLPRDYAQEWPLPDENNTRPDKNKGVLAYQDWGVNGEVPSKQVYDEQVRDAERDEKAALATMGEVEEEVEPVLGEGEIDISLTYWYFTKQTSQTPFSLFNYEIHRVTSDGADVVVFEFDAKTEAEGDARAEKWIADMEAQKAAVFGIIDTMKEGIESGEYLEFGEGLREGFEDGGKDDDADGIPNIVDIDLEITPDVKLPGLGDDFDKEAYEKEKERIGGGPKKEPTPQEIVEEKDEAVASFEHLGYAILALLGVMLIVFVMKRSGGDGDD